MRLSMVRFATVTVAFVLFVVACHDVEVSHANSQPAHRNTTIQSFNKAKKLMREVFAGHERTFYCGCAYGENTVDLQSCGYQPKKNSKRARQLEWEGSIPCFLGH